MPGNPHSMVHGTPKQFGGSVAEAALEAAGSSSRVIHFHLPHIRIPISFSRSPAERVFSTSLSRGRDLPESSCECTLSPFLATAEWALGVRLCTRLQPLGWPGYDTTYDTRNQPRADMVPSIVSLRKFDIRPTDPTPVWIGKDRGPGAPRKPGLFCRNL